MGSAAVTAKRFYGTPLPGVDPRSLQGKLVVIEGADGAGRSTQIRLLRDWLERSGCATAEVGLKRSELVGRELDSAMEGNTLCPLTFALFYATDFADQLEKKIVPALRAGFVVLADRYIFTLMARDIARGADPAWIRDVYGLAIVPDVVFLLTVPPKALAERNFRKNSMLDFWESGMDIRRSGDMYECFIGYQRRIQGILRGMAREHGFQIVNGGRQPLAVARDLRARLEPHLERVTGIGNGNGRARTEKSPS